MSARTYNSDNRGPEDQKAEFDFTAGVDSIEKARHKTEGGADGAEAAPTQAAPVAAAYDSSVSFFDTLEDPGRSSDRHDERSLNVETFGASGLGHRYVTQEVLALHCALSL